MTSTPAPTPGPGQVTARPDDDPTLGALVHDITQQIPDLIRSELRLAQVEMTEKGKRAGLGLGMFGAAGLLSFLGLATLVATAILALALALDAWLAALIVAVALLAAAGVVALLAKGQVERATPPKPEMAIEGLREDVATMKGQR
jgi:uncharacterized membrane protein YqjE